MNDLTVTEKYFIVSLTEKGKSFLDNLRYRYIQQWR